MKVYVLTAAGGNPTAVGVTEVAQDRQWYEKAGQMVMQRLTDRAVEQVGFLNVGAAHFEMAGGEFCGNGARAAGFLLADLKEAEGGVTFSCSGYDGPITVTFTKDRESAKVRGSFPNLVLLKTTVSLTDYGRAVVVDMGGIVHVVIEAPMPKQYVSVQAAIINELQLTDRDAVGVCWVTTTKESLLCLNPVVWVRSINTCFFESSCGSGSIAAAAVFGVPDVLQPTGDIICVDHVGDGFAITSTIAYDGSIEEVSIIPEI